MFRPPGECPSCGEFVPEGYKACPYCGADHLSGWKEEETTNSDGLDLPDESFDYDNFVQEEFGNGSPKNKLHPIWWLTALVLLLIFIIGIWGWSH
ncbi:MAG: hypothetical protein SH807_01470 [Blastochloris sp.]|jgi:hypothetical protein|nr:hypothetical protein [Blastochloris sp.]